METPWPSADHKVYELSRFRDSMYCRGNIRKDDSSRFQKICKLDFGSRLTNNDQLVHVDRGFFGSENFTNECYYAWKASAHNLGPKVFTTMVQISDKPEMYGIIEMENLHNLDTLKTKIDYWRNKFWEVTSFPEWSREMYKYKDFLVTLCSMFKTAYDLMIRQGKFLHMDLHSENIYLDSKTLKFIDYGKCLPVAAFEKGYVFSLDYYDDGDAKEFKDLNDALTYSTDPLKLDLDDIKPELCDLLLSTSENMSDAQDLLQSVEETKRELVSSLQTSPPIT